GMRARLAAPSADDRRRRRTARTDFTSRTPGLEPARKRGPACRWPAGGLSHHSDPQKPEEHSEHTRVRSPNQVNYGNRARYTSVTGRAEARNRAMATKGWRAMTGMAGTGTGADGASAAFAEEVARVRASGVLGQAGRLRELFDYLADRGPDAPSASQADIADAVFGQPDTEGDDATARVYV